MLKAITTIICLSCLTASNPAHAQVPEAWYDAATGGVTFENSKNIVGLRLESQSSILVRGSATQLNLLCLSFGGCVSNQAPDFIEWGYLLGINFESEFAGNILPAGLSDQEWSEDITFLFRTISEPSVDQLGNQLYVPEPHALTLGIFVVLTLMVYRNRLYTTKVY